MTATFSSDAIKIPPLREWHKATWEDYITLRDAPIKERMKLAYNQGKLWVDMGGEGINHSIVSDLFTMMFGFWAIQRPEQVFTSLGRCLIEKPETQACAPDLVLYIGEDYPQWKPREPDAINLTRWRVPNLVGEISDTTLADDLDQQKHLYEALGIPEYWVIDVRGQRVFAFQLQEGKYNICTESVALNGLPISVLEETLKRLGEGTNTSAGAWFTQEIVNLSKN
ncbi:Uma2 family endonuclease [Capilliphycus salinus ALCB114379]|uniref:Uma2 family endonuclease n=1 Tax=Capilliphycus salinus TaxID=2768948 RepID=UPI0039A44901